MAGGLEQLHLITSTFYLLWQSCFHENPSLDDTFETAGPGFRFFRCVETTATGFVAPIPSSSLTESARIFVNTPHATDLFLRVLSPGETISWRQHLIVV